MLIIILLLLLESSILFAWCMSQRDSIRIHKFDATYWQEVAAERAYEIHELRQENTSLGQMIDDRKRTISEQQQQLSEKEKIISSVKAWISNELEGA